MTDLEMTKLCAEAMGIEFVIERTAKTGSSSLALLPYGHYDPLHDDTQAMALVKKFRLSLGPDASGGPVWCCWDNDNNDVKQAWDDDPNRAIVECVAKMQERK